MSKTRTPRELEAAEYEAKAKAIRRAEKAFWSEVEERLDEVKDRFKLTDRKNVEGSQPGPGWNPGRSNGTLAP